MAAYSVADAKAQLPKLIDLAIGGDEVMITRHGRQVAELRPATAAAAPRNATAYEWLRARRNARPPAARSSVALLDLVYED